MYVMQYYYYYYIYAYALHFLDYTCAISSLLISYERVRVRRT